MFAVGERVKKTQPCFFNSNGGNGIVGVTHGNIGTVIWIDKDRKEPTYLVHFDGKSYLSSIKYHYTKYDLEYLDGRRI